MTAKSPVMKEGEKPALRIVASAGVVGVIAYRLYVADNVLTLLDMPAGILILTALSFFIGENNISPSNKIIGKR